MGVYITRRELELALSPTVYAAIYDDANNAVIDTEAVDLVISLAEGDATSYLVGFYTFPLQAPSDALFKSACLDFARARSFERNLDYLREFKETLDAGVVRKDAIALMLRIQAAVQKLPDQPNAAEAPKNTGGIVRVQGPRLITTGLLGEDNGSGF